MWKRLLRWIVFNVVLALIPLGMLLTFRYLADKLTFNDIAGSPEILFFALMISATSMGDLFEVLLTLGADRVLIVLGSALFVGLIVSAILFGGFFFTTLYEGSLGPEAIIFRSRLFVPSVVFSFVLLLVGTLTEVLLGRIEDDK